MIITVYFFYPETRGHSLEQMAVLFDGEDAEIAFPEATAEKTRASVVSAMLGAEERKAMKGGMVHVEEKSS